jgi:hypothetical protein
MNCSRLSGTGRGPSGVNSRAISVISPRGEMAAGAPKKCDFLVLNIAERFSESIDAHLSCECFLPMRAIQPAGVINRLLQIGIRPRRMILSPFQ